MVKKARLSSTLPNWRSYLYLDLKDPEELHPSLLPRDGTERVRWRERVHKGWAIGVEQADVIFQSRVAELVRDYTGMLLFLELNGNHIVLPPKVKVSLQGKNITETELIYDLTNYGLEKDGSFRITPKNTRGR
jgi:hypothetical protein